MHINFIGERFSCLSVQFVTFLSVLEGDFLNVYIVQNKSNYRFVTYSILTKGRMLKVVLSQNNLIIIQMFSL